MKYMRKLWLLLIPVWIFAVFSAGVAFIRFCSGPSLAEEQWWGFPLWMAGVTGVLLPAFIGGLALIGFLSESPK